MMYNANGKPLQAQLMECQAVLENTRTRLADTERQPAAAQAALQQIILAPCSATGADGEEVADIREIAALALSAAGADAETIDTIGGA